MKVLPTLMAHDVMQCGGSKSWLYSTSFKASLCCNNNIDSKKRINNISTKGIQQVDQLSISMQKQQV